MPDRSSSEPASHGVDLAVVRWPAIRRHWIDQIETDGERTWVLTLVPVPFDGGNLFSLDPKTLTVRQVAGAHHLKQIFAGEGRLWGIAEDGRRLLSLNPSTGESTAHALNSSCQDASPSGVVRLGKLWLSCDGVVSAYKEEGGHPEQVRTPHSSLVLGASHGVWVLTHHSLIGIAGDVKGRRISLGGAGDPMDWRAGENEAWARDLASDGKTLIRVDLSSGAIRRFKLETNGARVDSFALSRGDIWVALADKLTLKEKPLLLRFDRTDPRLPQSRLDLSSRIHSGEFEMFLTSGPTYLWVELFANRETQLFRVTVRK